MTIDLKFIDGSTATYQKSFIRQHGWSEAIYLASNWLDGFIESDFHNKSLFYFRMSASPFEGTKLNLYRSKKKDENYSHMVVSVIESNLIESDGGCMTWSVSQISTANLPIFIDECRSYRQNFLFLADNIAEQKLILSKLAHARANDTRLTIDLEVVVGYLLANEILPIRIWGSFDDEQLWVEIYTSESEHYSRDLRKLCSE